MTQSARFAVPITLFFFCLSAPVNVVLAKTTPTSQSAERKYEKARRHFYALLASEEKLAKRHNWDRVITLFDKVSYLHPKSDRAPDALYTTGLLYERLFKRLGATKDKEKALLRFNAVISKYPKSSLVDDAQRHIGDIRFSERNYKKAKSAYKKAKRSVKPKINRKTKSPQKTAKKTVRVEDESVSKLTGVESFGRSGYTRIILKLSSPTAYKAIRLKKPDRVFIDLLDTVKGSSTPKVIHFSKGIASSLRVAQNQSNVARVVIDLKESRSSHFVTALQNPFRIIVDVGRDNSAPAKKITKKTSPTRKVTKRAPPIKKPVRSERRAPVRKVSNNRIKTIVIDAGHGGKDPGAIGPTGLKEKHVTLAIAKKLKKALKKRMKCKVILTRTDDRYIALDERTVIANSHNADLFISIHVNASRNRKAYGLETYFLSPARSKDELATAARENMIAQKSGNTIENDLAYIMSDLSNTRKVNDSVSLAKSLQRSAVKGMRKNYRGIKNKGVKQAMFYVLWRATMPSVLLETGFISNRKEERRLRNPRYISRMADAIADGVTGYSRTYMVADNR